MDITLAGVSSLTDLLTKLPLPSPLPQESLLFHPQIAEKALKMLDVEDDKLVPQLVDALMQTSSNDIQLKDHYPAPDIKIDQPKTPKLLRAIFEKNPNVFNGIRAPHVECGSDTKNMFDDSLTLSNFSKLFPKYQQLPQTGTQQRLISPECNIDHNQPVVKLIRLSAKETVLTQKSLRKSSEDQPKEEITDMENNGTEDIFTALAGVEKRKNTVNEPEKPEILPTEKPKQKFVPVIAKLSIEELLETNTCQRFNNSIEIILQNVNESLMAELANDDNLTVPEDILLNRCQLQDLFKEAAKLKVLGAMEMIPTDLLVRLLNVLEINVRGADRLSLIADPKENENIAQLWMEKCLDRVMGAADASLCILYIMTSPNMPKHVYLEDCIDRVILFIKFQLHNTIFPHYDSIYRINPKKKDFLKRTSYSQSSGKCIPAFYNKIHELVNLLSELLNKQVMTDTTVLHASSVGVPPFFVENISELQLSSLKLVTTIFTHYEKHQTLLLDDILASIARLPNSKHSLRSFRLNSEEQIQMLTALVLQLIQGVVALPENLINDQKESASNKKTRKQMDKDMFICNKYEIATKTAGTFLTVFLNKCGNKNEAVDYRPLFENFVQDLLTTVNKPEWPAAELLLSLLGNLLMKNFSNKAIDMSLRLASVDYLGMVAAKLKKHTVLTCLKVNSIDQMIKDIKYEEMKDAEVDIKHNIIDDIDEEERMRFLQRVLLDYLAVNDQKDEAHKYARHFYIVQWYKDATQQKTRLASDDTNIKKNNSKENLCNSRKSNNKRKRNNRTNELTDDEENINNATKREISDIFRTIEERKTFYISKIQPFPEQISSRNRVQILQTYIDYNSAKLISQYLASKRSFSQSFDDYLRAILFVLRENSIAIRTKAMKCLTMIVEADPSVLGNNDMQIGVSHSFLDHSTSVREAAIDLVGKFILSRPELIDKYYDMISARILDTGVSVRKRVIKILKDICIEYPEFPKIPEICVKMIRRVNDEEGIRKLIMEVFQNMWFTPIPEHPKLDKAALLRKAMNITDVVASSRDIGLEWFEQLLVSLFKPKENKEDSTKIRVEPPKALLLACRQIVDCLIEIVLSLEESGTIIEPHGGYSERLVACFTTLNLFAKIRPQLLVKHASTLQPYLILKCQTKGDSIIISNVACTLEFVVPLMEHPSDTFLAQIEEDCIKLIIQRDRTVISSCLSCLGSIVNNVTRNLKLIRECFKQYYGNVIKFKHCLENDTEMYKNIVNNCRPAFRRAIFIVGLLLRHFDFTDDKVIGDLPIDIKDQVFHEFLYFLRQKDEDIQSNTLKAIGFICSRHYDFMLDKDLKKFYQKMLKEDDVSLKMKSDVLQNIELYLLEEDKRMIKLDQEWDKRSKEENLKEMGDVSSGMASTIIQIYLKEILTSYLHPDIIVRHASLKVIQLILQQGLVHPVQIVPYLICMSTDSEKIISHSADKQLMEIEKKYPGFIHTKSQLGIRLSYQLQTMLQSDVVRGFKVREQEEYPTALSGYLYLLLRGSRQQRRGLALNMLKHFDEQHTNLSYMLYLADNLAYFPYIVQDEVLFIVHHIDVMISVTGTNLLQSFREGLMATESEKKQMETNENSSQIVSALDEDDEDQDVLLARLPNNTADLQDCINATQGCLLLLVLKQHLKDIYGISDGKISQYSPSKVVKLYEKTAIRRKNFKFNPKATLDRLKQGIQAEILDTAGRKDLIAQYLDFKQLMLKLDLDDLDDEENADTLKSNLSSVSLGTTAAEPGIFTTPTATPKQVINRRRDTSENRRSTLRKPVKVRKLFE